jgi:hypothetical protein
MKLQYSASLLLTLMTLAVAGCGGGGGSSRPSGDPVAAVKTQEAGLRAARTQGNLDLFMTFYSDRYHGTDPNSNPYLDPKTFLNKPQLRQMLIMDWAGQSRFPAPDRMDTQYVVSHNGRQVQAYYVVVVPIEDPDTGATSDEPYPTEVDWAYESGTWRIIGEKYPGDAMLLNARRH